MTGADKNNLAIWVVTPSGKLLADQIAPGFAQARMFVSERLAQPASDCAVFSSLADAVKAHFHRFTSHVFIMSIGIVVRVIAPLLESKATDPAVVALDDHGDHVISLLSGHIGGANQLAHLVAGVIDADPVITTATDVNNIPAVDVLAVENKLVIENTPAIKFVNMALLRQKTIHVHDRFGRLGDCLPNAVRWPPGATDSQWLSDLDSAGEAAVWIDDVIRDFPKHVLTLRPATLAAGIGCNRNTGMEEIRGLLEEVMGECNLSPLSLKCIASAKVKAGEAGLIDLADLLGVPLTFYSRHELNGVSGVKNPSPMAKKHIGVESVCEAAAILASGGGTLIVPKRKTQNATLAVARIAFSSWESAPAAKTI